ncbi:MAG: hypothetical protein ACLGSD_10095 [Acidobacteriota bacterium]
MNGKSRILLTGGLAAMVTLAGCRVHVDKGANGEDKNVQVDTPFGGVHVNTDQVTASDLGLPIYPGAQEVKGDDNHKSADIHMGFGEWQMRVRVVSYSTADPQDKVAAFYKKALTRYGDVITCKDQNAIGTPAATSEGLTCADDGHHGNVQIHDHDYAGKDSLQLKAGSKRHQHIVAFDSGNNGGKTVFGLVALDLPSSGSSSQHSD